MHSIELVEELSVGSSMGFSPPPLPVLRRPTPHMHAASAHELTGAAHWQRGEDEEVQVLEQAAGQAWCNHAHYSSSSRSGGGRGGSDSRPASCGFHDELDPPGQHAERTKQQGAGEAPPADWQWQGPLKPGLAAHGRPAMARDSAWIPKTP